MNYYILLIGLAWLGGYIVSICHYAVALCRLSSLGKLKDARNWVVWWWCGYDGTVTCEVGCGQE